MSTATTGYHPGVGSTSAVYETPATPIVRSTLPKPCNTDQHSVRSGIAPAVKQFATHCNVPKNYACVESQHKGQYARAATYSAAYGRYKLQCHRVERKIDPHLYFYLDFFPAAGVLPQNRLYFSIVSSKFLLDSS